MHERVENWTELLASGDQAIFDELRMHDEQAYPWGGSILLINCHSLRGAFPVKKTGRNGKTGNVYYVFPELSTLSPSCRSLGTNKIRRTQSKVSWLK